MTTVWKGAINFGLLNVPVKLSTATTDKTVPFKSLHKKCLSPLNQKRWCKSCNKEVAYEDIVKGYEYQKGKFVVINEEDFSKLPIKSARYIQIIDFINLDEVDPIYFEKTYYLAPDTAGEKPYLILYNAMKEMRRVAVAKITIRQKEHLCLVRVYKDTLALNTMFFADEIKSSEAINVSNKVEVSKIEMDMAMQIIKNLTAEFDISKYHDEYREQLISLINAKIDGEDIVEPISSDAEEKFGSLLEKLRASVEATKSATAYKAEVKTKNTKKPKTTKGKTKTG